MTMFNPIMRTENQMHPDMQLVLHELRELRSRVDNLLQLEKPLKKTEASKHLGISTRQFDRLIETGEFPEKYVHKVSKCRRFFASELNEYAKSIKKS